MQYVYQPADDDYPFLTELAHYEFGELARRVSANENDLAGVDPNGDLLTGVPVKSVLSWAFAYQFPVHRISKDCLPAETTEQPSYLAIYRGSDDKVRFLELNPVTAALLDAVENNQASLSGEDLLRELATRIHYPDVDALISHGADALLEMRQLDILTGTRRAG